MISQTNRNLSDYYPANSSRATASLKRTAQDLELPDPPSKLRRVKFMKYRIRMDPKKSEPLAQISEEAYCNYTIGNYLEAANEYEEFLSGRSSWCNSDKEDNSLLVIQSIFNLTRCYLTLGQFWKARFALQELHDPKNGEALGWSHSLFTELTVLHSKINANIGDQKDSTRASQNCISQEPGTKVLKRSLNSVQRRSLLMSRNGNHKAAVELLSTSLTSLTIDLNNLESNFKDILVELHLRLAEEYNFTGQLSKGLSTLEQVWNPQMPLSITWGHKLFKNIANLYCTLKKGSA
ncbi:hypothetical protein KEM48_001350 [Puccinia striiformis f. sp. tritici PST-130]|nr:hypothetical protein KEM48_001350 [Puccinia striiformis f. sp. tritici PST-130]